ncbi:MAG: DUF5009 domain-containing protein [Phycisphaerae bacterium]|nr:DUF5009 domain-containing protein [Phycisphaerae bacterium]
MDIRPGSPPPRAEALDALRGLAILAMALQGMLYAYKLPAWMYHAQLPPPSHKFDPTLAGLTWVDLVFPFFLFSMGAAMPLALAGRIARGAKWWALAGYALRRGVMLLAFALYVDHIVPWKFQSDAGITTLRWLWSLLAFGVLFPALMRLPKSWAMWQAGLVRGCGWAGAMLLLATVRYPDGSGFSLDRADIIIVVLAHAVTVGSMLWLISRDNLPLRLGLMFVVLAATLGASEDGWVKYVWHEATPQRSLLLLGYLKYLLIVLPGTIAGDQLLKWQRTASDAQGGATQWNRLRHTLILALTVGMCVLLCCGLQARWLPGTTLVALATCAAGFAFFAHPTRPLEVLFRDLYGWGVLWLVVGLLLEPYEGGIKKDSATLSYFFVTSGMVAFALIALSVCIDVFRQRACMTLLIGSGQNPMIAYVGIRNLLPPVLALLGVDALAGSLKLTAWPGFGWACIKTLLLGAAVGVCTRWRVYWRT